MHHGKRLLDEIERRAEQLGNGDEIALEVAGLVGEIDKMMPDQPSRRIGEGECELLGEVTAERTLLGDIGFQIWRLAVGASIAAQAASSPALLSSPVAGASESG